jgi:hypothetical protein
MPRKRAQRDQGSDTRAKLVIINVNLYLIQYFFNTHA